MPKPTSWTSCTAQLHSGKFCDHPSLPDAPFPICLNHASLLMGYLEARIQATVDTPDLLSRLVSYQFDAVQERGQRQRAVRGAVVYYLAVGDLIKIGMTRDLAARLKSYPPDAKLLAVEPGDEQVERNRHVRFAGFLSDRREWFRPGEALMAHIVSLGTPSSVQPADGPRLRKGRARLAS